jgi:hypothetical protein
MVYYKKGVETWGVPFDNLSMEKIEKPSISVFPNPIARNEPLVISMMSEASHIEIINKLGETVLTSKVSKNSNQIDISRLQLGVYFVKCSYFNNHFIQKIVVY